MMPSSIAIEATIRPSCAATVTWGTPTRSFPRKRGRAGYRSCAGMSAYGSRQNLLDHEIRIEEGLVHGLAARLRIRDATHARGEGGHRTARHHHVPVDKPRAGARRADEGPVDSLERIGAHVLENVGEVEAVCLLAGRAE